MIEAVPLELKQANEFVSQLHRHHDAVYRDKFRIGAMLNGELVGVVQVGRPVSRMLDDGKTLEVVRLCTNGTKDVCSFVGCVLFKNRLSFMNASGNEVAMFNFDEITGYKLLGKTIFFSEEDIKRKMKEDESAE